MKDSLKLHFTKAEWQELGGPQRLIIGLLKRIIADLRPQPKKRYWRRLLQNNIDEVVWWMDNGALGPDMMEAMLLVNDGVIRGEIEQRLADAKRHLD